MQGPCAVIAYVGPNGRSPVLEFLEKLDRFEPDSYATFLYAKDLIAENGTDIGIPHWKWLKDGLGEIRWRMGRKRMRITCSEETDQRVVMLDPIDGKKRRVFGNDDRRTALTRRDDFRSPSYNQANREYLYHARKRNAGNP